MDLWPLDLDELRSDPQFPGTEAPRIEGHGVVGTASGEGVPGLVLQGHVDVVPVGDLANWAGESRSRPASRTGYFTGGAPAT